MAAALAERAGAHDGSAQPGDRPSAVLTVVGRASSESERGIYKGTDVVPLMETLSDGSMKRLFRAVYGGVGACAALLVALLGMKFSRAFDDQDRTRPVAVLGWAVAAFGATLLTVCLAVFLWRLRAVWRAGSRWAARRWRWTVIFLLQFLCIYVCDWFTVLQNLGVVWGNINFLDIFQAGVVGGMADNTFMALVVINARSFNLMVDRHGRPLGPRQDSLWLDAPWHRFGRFIGVYWLLYAGIALWFTTTVKVSGVQLDTAQGRCRIPWEATLVIYLIVATYSGYMFLFLYFMRRAFVLFSKRSYVHFRWENILLRLTFRMVGIFVLFTILSMAFLGFVRIESCMSYVLAIFGFPPALLARTLLVALNTILMLPTIQMHDRPMRALLCRPVWMEEHDCGFIGCDGLDIGDVQPVFCFETAVKLLYWCECVYEYNPRTDQVTHPLDLRTGLSLYGFTQFAYMETAVMDAHAMVAWHEAGVILLCFRGTYSKANVMADIKLWRTVHPPKRGLFWLGTRPFVHKGFLESWKGEHFDQRVLAKVRGIIEGAEIDKQNVRVLVSGHSLGGAIAILAAHDIAKLCCLSPHQLSCYTFGCPRVGNSAFADEYNKIVPNTWHVINDLDPVPRMAKFWMLYKRSGRRVVVNSRGDIIISPMFLEFKLSSAFMGKVKLAHHRLSSYRKSLRHVAAAQFHKHKSLPGGHDALRELCGKGCITKVLNVGGGAVGNLARVASRLWGHELHQYVGDGISDDGADIGTIEDGPVDLLLTMANSIEGNN